jgi:hypothetical protein
VHVAEVVGVITFYFLFTMEREKNRITLNHFIAPIVPSGTVVESPLEGTALATRFDWHPSAAGIFCICIFNYAVHNFTASFVTSHKVWKCPRVHWLWRNLLRV